jgi:hypothetical protein
MLKGFMKKKQEYEFEKLADRVAEDIAKAIVLSTLGDEDKQGVIDKYTKTFIDKFNNYMDEFSSMKESDLFELLTLEVMGSRV